MQVGDRVAFSIHYLCTQRTFRALKRRGVVTHTRMYSGMNIVEVHWDDGFDGAHYALSLVLADQAHLDTSH